MTDHCAPDLPQTMSHTPAETILAHLHEVERLRHHRMAQVRLTQTTEQLKHFQQDRFRRSYADLLQHPRYTNAAQFFLSHLYGPGDFSRRDAQFARVVPAVVRVFPSDVVGTVAKLAQLHALSEGLDTRMAEHLIEMNTNTLTGAAYLQAWQTTGRPELRGQQIELTIAIGTELDRLTRKPLLRQALRLMRGPAAAAGLDELQTFLEVGFDTFRAMKGAQEFLKTVETREQELSSALFAADVHSNTDADRNHLAKVLKYFPA